MLAPGTITLALLNHLLEREDWARQKLRPYSGQTVKVEGGPLQLAMTVLDMGSFRPAAPEEAPTVTISFADDAPIRLLTNPASLFTSARLTGPANFAETLAFVFRNLRWDYEADLAGVIGDIPGRRLAHLLAEGIAWHRSATRKLGANMAEYASEELELVMPARDILRFANEVDRLRDDLARLEKRISRLLSP